MEDTALVKKHKGIIDNMKPVVSKNEQNKLATKKNKIKNKNMIEYNQPFVFNISSGVWWCTITRFQKAFPPIFNDTVLVWSEGHVTDKRPWWERGGCSPS